MLSVPLRVGSEIIGTISAFSRSPGFFTTRDQVLLQSFADQAGIAIQNARLFEESQRRARETQALLEAGRAVSQSLEVGETIRVILQQARAVLGVQSCSIFTLDPNTGELTPAASLDLDPESAARIRIRVGEGVTGLAVQERRPVQSPHVDTDPRVRYPQLTGGRGLHSMLATPLLVGDRAIGALTVLRNDIHDFTPEEVALAAAFADQAAIALENARLYQNTRQAYEDLARAQNELLHSQKMEAIGRLAGGVAHDFNNLLTVIIGRAHLLETRLGGVDLRDIHLLYRTALRAADLTEQLLTFSRKQARQPRMLDLNEVVTSMSSLLRRLIGEHVELSTRTAPDLGQVEADPAQIEQVIMNLAVNARDAMPEGGRLEIETADVHVGPSEIRRHPVLEPGRYVVLAVTDTGCGMDGGTQERIFEPFFTTKDVGKGTGLGLAMVYGIVKQSGGHITVESEPDRGSRLTVFLPRVADPAPAPLAAEPAATPLTGDETILLVEDEPDVRALARQILSARGYLVLEAADAQSALALCDQHPGPIDLMLTDVVMPRMSGWQLARALAGRRPATKVLFMSGYPRSQILRNPTAGADFELLSKPFSPSSLAGRVREALDRPLPAAPDPTS
jgi:signal transduction histidine kinase/CheY-like chemotaxis protein